MCEDSASARQISIGSYQVGPLNEPFVIAEMSGNHNGSLDCALSIVDAIADSGAHAVKLQTYRADTMTLKHDGPAFRVSQDHILWGGRTLYSLYEEAQTPWDWHPLIFERAKSRGLVAFSSPFDRSAVDLLESLGAPAYKIASLEITDLPLIRLAASTGKPVIISTGTATLAEIDLAVRAVRETGNDQVIVLGCTSSYPASPSDTNLRGLPVLADATQAIVGLSDHTPGVGVAVAAVAFGASVLEKHVTLSRAEGGVDSSFSIEPSELRALVLESRRAWEALGTSQIGPMASETESLRLRRSLYVVSDVKAGETVTQDNVRALRPAGGMAPSEIDRVLGRVFLRDVSRGTPLTWDVI